MRGDACHCEVDKFRNGEKRRNEAPLEHQENGLGVGSGEEMDNVGEHNKCLERKFEKTYCSPILTLWESESETIGECHNPIKPWLSRNVRRSRKPFSFGE
ncbi:Hypothetical predicted protein [Octopus vulgaris]|uniref:Uncharacterized protein n=1 Tax=Octopus vulgaris TaxID=6645 RepID=A0AA36FJF7_OCTVU|nr:Hypothetical predicted protein [Octopus vulgaris]